MSVTDELLANNARYAETFQGPLPLPPAKHVAVLACMDARLNVYGVARAAGGRRRTSSATRVASSPTTRSARWPSASACWAPRRSSSSTTRTAGCSPSPTTSSSSGSRTRSGSRRDWARETFSDLAEDVRQSIDRIQASPFIPHTDQVRGFVFDVATGKLDEVV